jgi:hypothetical protein
MKFTKEHARLFISFSGGKTSAYMANRIVNSDHGFDEIVVGFANTGQEHDKTLEYVQKCDKYYGLGVVWLEAVVNPEKGMGTRHKVVNFDMAARDGRPFEDVVRKHGLPNTQFPHCTRETKLNPIKSYLRSIGWGPRTYHTAIGIRADEMDRMSPVSIAQGAIYPLIELGITKGDVLEWEQKQPVRLGIPEHYGNCIWCWKKSFRKLGTVAREMPEAFKFPEMLEKTYKDAGAGIGDKRIFRGRRLTSDIFALANDPDFEPFVDGFPFKDDALDTGMSCGESCEIGVDGPKDDGIA